MNPGDFTRIRRKLGNGADLVTGFRFARLFHDGGALAARGDLDEMWQRTTAAIIDERRRVDADHWSADMNRLIGLHQCRIAIRRMRAANARRIAA